uniref:Post-GPI attachment to proteins factor 2 n=1 Tax=Steinernema glaseri TaxID=37863 RepID=A0A1I7Y5V0_9BILA
MRGENELISIPFRHIVYSVAGLPLSALFICIFLSVTLHLNQSTRTHCGVDNWLPSVSAAVASFSPERYIWRVLIALHAAPRLVLAFAFRNHLLTSPIRSPSTGIGFALLCQLACFLNLAENIFLLLLTSISSVEDHEAHKISFIGFAFCAISYMFLATGLYNYSNRRQLSTMGEASYQRKLLFCWSSVVSIIFACYFYYRHNTFCETGVYTLFALSEYCVIISNILFHSTAYYDFDGLTFSLSGSARASGDYQTLLPLHGDKRII